MKRVFLCSILFLFLVVQSKKYKKYLVEVEDDDQGGRHFKKARLSNKNQASDESSDEVEDFLEEHIEETKDEETVIESRGKKYIMSM